MSNFNNQFNPYMQYFQPYGGNNQAYMNAYPTQFQNVAPVQQMQAPNVPSIVGRVISNVNEVRVQDVPTDGNVAFFPVNDGSCIYAKAWNADGTINTIRFVPEKVEPVMAQPNQELDDIRAQLSRIEEMLNRRNNYRGKRDNNESAE